MTTMIKITDLMKPGNTAVITGASSGIGKAAALQFAKAGMHVWMIDIENEELSLAQKMVKSQSTALDQGQMVLAERIDVSDYKLMCGLAEQVFEATGNCSILMNNAGIDGRIGDGADGGAVSSTIDTFDRVLKVNTYGPIHGCQAFIPKMKASGKPGIIINTGSKQGITCPPGNLPYNMSKAALKVYTEGLEHELMLERSSGTGQLRAALLVPGWVNTSIMLKKERAKAIAKGEGSSFDPSSVCFHEDKPADGAWMPHQVIDIMKEELDHGRFYIICPDHEVDRITDDIRMTWTMQDITENRPPLSRWHPDYKEPFNEYLQKVKGTKKEP